MRANRDRGGERERKRRNRRSPLPLFCLPEPTRREWTNEWILSRILSRSLFRSLSLSPSASGRGAPDPRTALSRAGQVDERSRLRSFPRGSRSTLVAAHSLARAYSRLRAHVCARTTRFRFACAYRRRTSHTHTYTLAISSGRERGERRRYISLLLSLRVAHCRSRFAKPAPKVPPYRSHSLAFPLFHPSRGPVVVSPSAPRGRCPTSFRPVRYDGNARRTANQPPTNRSNRPTALHYPPSTTGAQPLPCHWRRRRRYRHRRLPPPSRPPSLCLFPACSFLHPLSRFLYSYPPRSRSRASHPVRIHIYTCDCANPWLLPRLAVFVYV